LVDIRLAFEYHINALPGRHKFLGSGMLRKMRKKILLFLIFLSVLQIPVIPGQQLTFEQVYLKNGESVLDPLPVISEWSDDRTYFEEKDGLILKVDAVSGKHTVCFGPQAVASLKKMGLDLTQLEDKTRNYDRCVFLHGGYPVLFFKKNGSVVEFGKGHDIFQNPRFSPDGRQICLTSGGNLYVFDIDSGHLSQLTVDGNTVMLNGYASWVYYEEILGRRSHYKAFWWSPDSKKIAFMRFNQEKVPVFTLVNSSGDYGKVKTQFYPKPGYPNPQVQVGIADVEHKTVDWIDIGEDGDFYLSVLGWGNRRDELFIQWMNRSQDMLRIYAHECRAKKTRVFYQETQKHWIEFLESDDFRFLKNGDMVIRSSKDGWYHLYLITGGGFEKQLTRGNWSVRRIAFIRETEKRIYFEAGIKTSTENNLYGISFAGKQRKRLTFVEGVHRIEASLQGSFFIDTFSSLSVPPQMEIRNRKGFLVRKVADQKSSKLGQFHLGKAELFSITTSDGYRLPVVWYLPPDFDKNKRYPVVVKVYGGPGIPIVENSFDWRLRNYFLAQQGIVVLIMDHRGAGHFGKKVTDLMHRNLGKWEMFDCIEVVKYLRTCPFLDANRIGITGGSYGGYVTALALTSAPDYFCCGIADYSVIDWKLYDSVYTERYMDTPAENAEGYKESSVLNYIGNYRGGLRITHGSMDDNVHMQNTLQFMTGILSRGKTAELMIYPGEAHGYRTEMKNEYYQSTVNFWLRAFFSPES
jgi:dipeptidyl-peptidase-4